MLAKLGKRTFVAGAIGLALSTLAVAAQAQDLKPVKLRLDWVWQAPQSIFTIAKERGYYADEGLDVTIDRGYGGMDNNAALGSGEYDFLFGDINNVMLFNEMSPDNKEISVLQIYDAYPGSIIVRADSGINEPKDLEGKTIGAPVVTGGRVMFPALAEANDIDESKVIWETVSMQLQDQQFAQGRFDAIAGFTTTSLLNLEALGMKREDLKVIGFTDWGVDLYGAGVVVRQESLTEDPEMVRGFVRATIKGIQDMMLNKEEAIKTLQAYDPLLDMKTEVNRLDVMIDMLLDREAVHENGIGYVEPSRVEGSIDIMMDLMGLETRPDASDVYTMDFLPPQEERMLTFPQ